MASLERCWLPSARLLLDAPAWRLSRAWLDWLRIFSWPCFWFAGAPRLTRYCLLEVPLLLLLADSAPDACMGLLYICLKGLPFTSSSPEAPWNTMALVSPILPSPGAGPALGLSKIC